MGGLVVALTGKNPFKVYHAVFNGHRPQLVLPRRQPLSARIPFSTHKMWFPWDTASIAARNLQQTLLLTTPIILTALAVAFAFRCGMFNIGGQGQYLAGTIFAVWLGSSFVALNPCAARDRCASSSARSPARPGRASPASSRRPSARTR